MPVNDRSSAGQRTKAFGWPLSVPRRIPFDEMAVVEPKTWPIAFLHRCFLTQFDRFKSSE